MEKEFQKVEGYQFLVLQEEGSCLKVFVRFAASFYPAKFRRFAMEVVVYRHQKKIPVVVLL